MNDTTLIEINKFLRTRKGNVGGYNGFRKTGLYEHHGNLFGHLIYTEDTTYNYIGVDAKGNIYDEFYYPYEDCHKVGTIIPKHLLEQDYKPFKGPIDPVWKDVAEKGYGIVDNTHLSSSLASTCLAEGFIPHGHKDELNLSKSIYHSYFDPLKDGKPEEHISRDYIRDSADELINQIPPGQTFVNHWAMHTTDLKKYIYDPENNHCDRGAFSFHMDYFERCLFMFFKYIPKSEPIVGRELLVGFREDFKDFSTEALDLSPDVQPAEESPFARLKDESIVKYDRIPISSNRIILMNTMNPMIVHRVEKLRQPNEVVLLVTNMWCPERIYED